MNRSSRFVAQVWLEFQGVGIEWPEVAVPTGRLRMKVVPRESGSSARLLLLETDTDLASLDDDRPDSLEFLARCVRRMRWMTFDRAVICAGRVVDTQPTEENQCRWRQPRPTAIGADPFPVRFHGDMGLRVSKSALHRDVQPEVDRAVEWSLAALGAKNPLVEFQCWWAAVEALAPPLQSSWRCSSCSGEIRSCPVCSAPTSSPRVVAAIAQLLKEVGLDGREMYKLRSKIIHGQRSFVASSEDAEVFEHLNMLRDGVVKLIANRLGMKSPPHLAPSTQFFVHTNAILETEWHPCVLDVPGVFLPELPSAW